MDSTVDPFVVPVVVTVLVLDRLVAVSSFEVIEASLVPPSDPDRARRHARHLDTITQHDRVVCTLDRANNDCEPRMDQMQARD